MHDSLGDRMKNYYEDIPNTKLVRRTPVVLRIDGKSFHSYSKGFMKPFDDVLIRSMQQTAKYLCENIQGAVLAYTQSDEITLILVDYKTLESGCFFDYRIQKICSIAASMATMAFNKIFADNVSEEILGYILPPKSQDDDTKSNMKAYHEALMRAISKGAMFDCRCFNIPKEEVCNMILWRQLDAIRNSIQMVGQANFSHKELQNKSCNDIKEMLLAKGINWDELPVYKQRGTCIVKKLHSADGNIKYDWIIDENIPIFKGSDREYIDELIYVGE